MSRAISTTSGRSAASESGRVRRNCTGLPPAARAMASCSGLPKKPELPPALLRTYRSAGRMWRIQSSTEMRKLATMMPIATIRLKLASTPPSAIEAWPGALARRDRVSASTGGGFAARSSGRLSRRKAVGGQARHQADAADQQQGDREVAEQGQLEHRRREGEQAGQRQADQRGPDARQVAQRRLVVAGLQGHGRLRARRFQRRRQAAEQGHAQAEREEDAGRDRREHDLRLDAGEVAGAEVAAEEAQRQRRQRVAGGHAQQGAEHAQAGPFDQHLAQQLAAFHAQHAQQRELAAPAHHRQGLGREHEEGAGEQGDQGQHGEVHAVGAAEVIVAALLVAVVRLLDPEAAREVAFEVARRAALRIRRG